MRFSAAVASWILLARFAAIFVFLQDRRAALERADAEVRLSILVGCPLRDSAAVAKRRIGASVYENCKT